MPFNRLVDGIEPTTRLRPQQSFPTASEFPYPFYQLNYTNTAEDCLASRYCYRRTTIFMRVNAGDSIPISRKEREAPKDCGCKEGRRRGRGLRENFLKKFWEWGSGPPSFTLLSSPTPLHIPQGVSRGTCFAWAWHVLTH